MKLIITEKNSVAQNIAHTIGAYTKINADKGMAYCYGNDEYYVAFARGHLYSLAEPDVYGADKNFKRSYQNGELPIFPEEFKVIPNKDSSLDDLRQFLTALINKPDVTEIINACDAAREGELIFREIYNASGSTKPVKRFWVSSVTEEAIKDGIANLKSAAEFENLYHTAKVRAELDWLFGMNLSRLYTALDEGYTHSVGRIVTPVLGIIVGRDNEIANFVKHTSYKLILDNGALSDEVYEEKAAAEIKCNESQGKPVNVQSVIKTEKTENRPRMYSLTRLQMDANDLYGYTADEVLSIAQSLYEKKFTTYPRTGSECLSEDMVDTVTNTVKMLSGLDEYAQRAADLFEKGLNLDKRVIDNSGVTDHHAIIPTLQDSVNTTSLSEKEENIYRMVVNRFLMALDDVYKYEEIKYEFWCEDITYTLTAKQPKQLGWRRYRPHYSDDKDEAAIPDYNEGSTFDAVVDIKECTTQPPHHFTDKTLLSVMENIDNRIDDSELKSAVKGKGIGTDATRASIIEKLINTKYIERRKKELISTDFGKQFVASLPRQILSVERTAEWEQAFDDIQHNGGSDSGLYEETKKLVSNIINYEKSNTERKKLVNPESKSKFETVVVGKCPRCGKDIIEKKGFFGCSSYESKENAGCGFSFSAAHRSGWFKGSITAAQAKKLLNGENITLKAVSQDGKEYPAEWKLSDDGVYVNVVKVKAVARAIGKCPRCGKDVIEKSNSFSCSSYESKEKTGCGFSIFKHDNKWNVDITAKNAAELLKDGVTVIKQRTLNGEKATRYKLVENEVNGRKWVNLVPEE